MFESIVKRNLIDLYEVSLEEVLQILYSGFIVYYVANGKHDIQILNKDLPLGALLGKVFYAECSVIKEMSEVEESDDIFE